MQEPRSDSKLSNILSRDKRMKHGIKFYDGGFNLIKITMNNQNTI